MEYDKDKVDKEMLAFLWLTMLEEGYAVRAWKRNNWEHMDQLHEKGYIDNSENKAKQVIGAFAELTILLEGGCTTDLTCSSSGSTTPSERVIEGFAKPSNSYKRREKTCRRTF